MQKSRHRQTHTELYYLHDMLKKRRQNEAMRPTWNLFYQPSGRSAEQRPVGNTGLVRSTKVILSLLKFSFITQSLMQGILVKSRKHKVIFCVFMLGVKEVLGGEQWMQMINSASCFLQLCGIWQGPGSHGEAWFGLVCVPTESLPNTSRSHRQRVHLVQTQISKPSREH